MNVRLCLVVLSTIFLCSCDEVIPPVARQVDTKKIDDSISRPEAKMIRIDNVVRIIMSDFSKWFFFFEYPSTDQIGGITVGCYGGFRIVTDVHKDQKCWVMYGGYNSGKCAYNYLEIHIHKASEINAGGWTRRNDDNVVTGMNSVIE